ncbi:MAG: hypothetical protein ACI4LX_11415 [Treponema sp.]
MSSQNDKNELDNYGVWVKKPPKDIKADADFTDESFSLDAELPDFDNPGDSDKTEDSLSDFDFSVDEVKEETIEDPFADIDFETEENGTAKTEETATEEITENTEIASDSEQAADSDGTDDDFNIDDITSDISFDDLDDINIEQSIEQTEDNENTSDIEEPIIESPAGDIMSEQTFDNAEEFTEDKPVSDTGADSSETIDIDLDSMEDGEVDLDSFLSDDSSSSETQDVSASFGLDSSETENLNIDEFIDAGDFGDFTSDSKPKQEEIIEEDPLDINLSFDETADSFEVEEDTESQTENQENENAAVSDSDGTGEEIDTESIDLSEFGIDESGDEQPLNGPEDAIKEHVKETVDYDLKVSADTDDDTTVSISDVVAGNITSDSQPDSSDEQEEPQESAEPEEQPQPESRPSEISLKEQEILQQIAGELASLKNEIKNLKTDFEDLKAREADVRIPEQEKENSGFFADSDEDDTIALSGDELDNILNSAEFLDETEDINNNITADSIQENELSDFQSDVQQEENAGTSQFESTIEDDNEGVYDSAIDSENTLEAETSFEPALENDGIIEEDISSAIDQEPVIEETAGEDELSDFEISEDLPEEIEIPKVEDLSDSPSDSDFTADDFSAGEESAESSVSEQESEQDEFTASNPIDDFFNEDDSIDSALTSEKLDYIAADAKEETEIQGEQSDEEISDLDLPSPTVDDIADNTLDELDGNSASSELSDNSEEIEITETEEPVFEETSVDEPVIETTDFNDEISAGDDLQDESVFAGQSDSEPEKENVSNEEIPSDLKQEIKSVLSYMDQLLENLPEDKISEFAQSEHFVTYKKLFQELGLS